MEIKWLILKKPSYHKGHPVERIVCKAVSPLAIDTVIVNVRANEEVVTCQVMHDHETPQNQQTVIYSNYGSSNAEEFNHWHSKAMNFMSTNC